jgi:hypothetical protein
MGEYPVSLTMGNHQHPPSLFTLCFFCAGVTLKDLIFPTNEAKIGIAVDRKTIFKSCHYFSKQF